mgnify:CR=1 FL=1
MAEKNKTGLENTDVKETITYWCCVLGGPRTCILDCSKCLHNKKTPNYHADEEENAKQENVNIKYLDIKE